MSGVSEIKAMLGTGSVDSRSIHFGANESKEDRMRRIEEITKGNPNVKLSPEAFQKLMQGGDVDVTLNLDAPDRRNLFIGAFATLAQIGGSAGGAAYNKDLGEAVTSRVSGDAQFVAKHGNNYKMNLFGGAEAQTGSIQVGENTPAQTDPIITDQIKKLLSLQASNIHDPIIEQKKAELRTSILEKAQKYSNLSFQEHINKTQDSSVGLAGVHGFEKNNNPYAKLLNLGSLEKLGFKTSEAQILAGAANAKTGVVQGINVSKESELSGSTTSLNLEAVLYLQAKAKGSALNKKEIATITKDFNAHGTDNLVGEKNILDKNGKPTGGKYNVTQTSVDQLRSKVAEAKVAAVKDFTTGIFSSLDTEGKVKFLSNLKGVGKSEEELKKLSSGELDSLFKTKLNGGNASLFEVFKASEKTYNENTSGAKIDGLIGRQHILGVQKLLNDRLENLQASAANLTILAGNRPTLGGDKKLDNFYNGEFVGDDKKASLIAKYEERNGPIKSTDKWSFMVKEQQSQTLAIYNEANGTDIKSFEDLARKAVSGGINGNVAKAIVFSSDEQEKIAGIINGTNSGTNKNGLALSKIGADVYGKNNNVLQENLKNLSVGIDQNRSNANIIKNSSNITPVKTGESIRDQVSLSINGESETGTVGQQVKRIKDALDKENGNISISPEDQANILDVLKKANPSDPAIADLEKTFSSIKDKASTVEKNSGAVGSAKAAQTKPSDPLLDKFSNIGTSLPPAEKPKDDSSLKKVLDELARAGNEVASKLFGVADQILDRLNKEAAGSFDYGFGHQNGGRITSKIGGAADQDKNSNGNSNVSSQSFEDGLKTGERTKAAFDVLAQYKANREAEARDGSVSIREGVRKYNDNIEKYVAGSTPAEKSQIRGKDAMDFPLTEATKNEPAKYGQSTALKSPIDQTQTQSSNNNTDVDKVAKLQQVTP